MTNKFAVVTGASTGIGRAIAVEFGKQNSTIVLVARSKARLEETKKLVEDAGGTGIILICDLSKTESTNNLISEINKLTDQVDFLANIAGLWHGENEVYAGKDFEKFDQQVILDTLSVGLTSPILLVHGLLPLMHEDSIIVNLSGTFENGAKGWLPYFVSKRALEDLTVGLSQELEVKGIKVFGISPSDTATESYAKYFPQYMDEAINPEAIAKFVGNLMNSREKSGNIFLLKKDTEPINGFHV